MGQCHPVFEQLGPRYDLSQYKGSQDEESNNNFNILAKIKHLLAGYIFCTRLWTKLFVQYFSSFIDIAMAVYKSGTGTRGRGHGDACVGTWGRETRDLGTSSMGRGDVWDGDARAIMIIEKVRGNAPINVKPAGGDRAWGGDLIVFVVPGVGHLTDLVLPGEGIFESFFARHGDI